MSLRDIPDSHKVLIPLVAGLQIVKAYDPNTGGIGGPGKERTNLPEIWITRPGDPPDPCDIDPPTDKFLVLHLDASKPETLVLTEPEEPITDPDEQERWDRWGRQVIRWLNRVDGSVGAAPVKLEFAPRFVMDQPFFPQAVDFAPEPLPEEPEEEA